MIVKGMNFNVADLKNEIFYGNYVSNKETQEDIPSDYLNSCKARNEDCVSTVVLSKINDAMMRHYDDCGNWSYSDFIFNEELYRVDVDGVLYMLTDSGFKVKKVNWVRHGKYPEYRFTFHGRMCFVKAYVLSMVAMSSNVFTLYINGYDINHKVVFKNDRNNRMFDKVMYDPKYLEVISRSENIRHGKFAIQNGLYGVYISSEDVNFLESKLDYVSSYTVGVEDLVCQHNKNLVNEFYSNLGIETDFNRN